MKKNIEFYIYNKELWYMSEGVNKQLTENDKAIVGEILDKIMNLYPDAYKALAKEYKRSALNVAYYQYLIVRRFCKCNFGALDDTRKDIDVGGNFSFECVACPLRGECIHEGVICSPRLNTKLNENELRVIRMYHDGYTSEDITQSLYISEEGLKTMRKRIYRKLDVKDKAELMVYVNKHNLLN